jgi:hypothetical protein
MPNAADDAERRAETEQETLADAAATRAAESGADADAARESDVDETEAEEGGESEPHVVRALRAASEVLRADPVSGPKLDPEKLRADLAEVVDEALREIEVMTAEMEEALAEPWSGTETQGKARLFGKIAAVMGTVSAIPRDQYRHVEVETSTGGSYSYDFIPESVLMERIRPELAARGVAVLYSDKLLPSPEEDDNLVTVEIAVTFADGETGAHWTCRAVGQGTDKGDKAASKAKTTAMRYLIWKMFLVSGDLEPEAENVDRRSGGGGGGGRKGRPATPKQVDFANRILTEAMEAGLVDTEGRNAIDAVQVRQPVVDLDGRTCSWLIDETMAAKKAIGTGPELAAIAAKWTAGLDEHLGTPVPPDAFPPGEEERAVDEAARDGWTAGETTPEPPASETGSSGA